MDNYCNMCQKNFVMVALMDDEGGGYCSYECADDAHNEAIDANERYYDIVEYSDNEFTPTFVG